jgi:hypothetical protein
MRRLTWVLILLASLLGDFLAPLTYAQAHSSSNTSISSQNAASHNTDNVKCNDNGTYINSQGQKVKRPENCSGPPSGATAQCRDGSYSFSRNHRGTCSHHGGVAKWL